MSYIKKIIYFSLAIFIVNIANAGACQLIRAQCQDKSPTKLINGVTYNLTDACKANGLTGDRCCWDSKERYYCGDATDTCKQYRTNPNCKFIKNDCNSKDPLTGICLVYQSTYTCANAYIPVESQLCTNAICVNNNNNTSASSCFLPGGTASQRTQSGQNNTNSLIKAVSILETGKQIADDGTINCQGSDPLKCMIFKGDYYNCKIWQFTAPNNNGSDCILHDNYFSTNSAGLNASDKSVYGSTSIGQTSYDASNSSMNFNSNGFGVKPGDQFNYSLSNNDNRQINNSISTYYQANNFPVTNQDQNVPYNPNSSNNRVSTTNGMVSSVTINNDAGNKTGFFNQYLTANSVKLAWNRKKASSDPNNVKTVTFNDMGISRRASGNVGAWGGDKPYIIQGLCVYLANSCDGGNDDGTNSIAGKVAGLGNANACFSCVLDMFGVCEPENLQPHDVNEEWCCFSSKIAMDLNLAAYDQGLVDLFNGNPGKYKTNVINGNGKCGGITIETLSKIDFSKGNYLADFTSSIDTNKFMNSNALQGQNEQSNMTNRGKSNATSIVQNH
ncbi:MAG: hypothetical protein K2P99_04585 [Burkholderiales bacterium]|nr:hypothetical protein [Burkholderiales bacterium]